MFSCRIKKGKNMWFLVHLIVLLVFPIGLIITIPMNIIDSHISGGKK